MATFNWASATRSLALNPVSFVRATPSHPPPPPDPEEGDKTKEFYESIINDDETSERKRRRRKEPGEKRRWRKTNDDKAYKDTRDTSESSRSELTLRDSPKPGTSYDILIDDSSSRDCKVESDCGDVKPTVVNTETEPKDTGERRASRSSFSDSQMVKNEASSSAVKTDYSLAGLSNAMDSSTSSLQTKRLRYKFFSAAQEDDVVAISSCMDLGVGVNEQDDFGWTALMIASSAGSVEVVRHLVEIGADKTLSTSTGVSAMSLVDTAEASAKQEIKALLSASNEEDANDMFFCSPSHTQVSTIHFCEACDACYAESEMEHVQSVTHLLRLNGVGKDAVKPDLSVFEIGGNNRGFKLMVDKMGWDANSGLGKEGEGRRYPIKTQLKKDRKGLGAVVDGKKCSIKTAGDTTSTVSRQSTTDVRKGAPRIMRQNTISRLEAQRRSMKEKKWEINMRRYMKE